MRLVVSVVLLGLLTGCVSDHHGYYRAPVYGPVYQPYYGPTYHHVPRPYVVVPGHAHHGYRLEHRDYRGPIHRHHEPRQLPALPPHRVHPPVRPQPPIVVPGYRHEGGHHQGRPHSGEGRQHAHEGRSHSRDDRPSYQQQRPDRGGSRADRWQNAPRPQWGGGQRGHGESRRTR